MSDGPSPGAAGASEPASRDAAGGATIVVCASCRFPGQDDAVPRPGSLLAEATRAAVAGQDIGFRRAACLGNCRRGLSAAILRDGCWSYLFGELDAGSAGDLVEGARLLAAAADGFMPYRQRPEALKRGLVARIPTSANLEDLPT